MNKRVFIKKRADFLVESHSLLEELKENLKETGLTELELYNIYDIFDINDEEFKLLKEKILSEVVTDEVYDSMDLEGKNYLAIEFLPGQYDQRADSAEQCLALLEKGENTTIKSGRLIVFHGEIQSFEKIKKYLINPIESREKNLNLLEKDRANSIEKVKFIDNFNTLNLEELKGFLKENQLALNIEDLVHIQNYFKNTEKRAPSETELKVLDTYWSDHCRHTTFETHLKEIAINSGDLKDKIQSSFDNYLNLKKSLKKENTPITLMDMATIGAKYLKSIGKLNDLEDSKENNACSIEIDVDVDDKTERYLLMFKNETHNHPTEIEPFGGASTCVGGAIRDPLSGRAYVYQAMRITGAGDITENVEDTLPNKLPQKIISKGAAQGYSSYGNQIGLATTYVREIFHPGYKAKRMEVGVVVGAVKKSYVKREEPSPGDLVVVMGGRTGRDGIGGATGSSKEHDDTSLEKCSSEVQKGNAPIERRIQRLFKNPNVTKLIKKSNDFGAGGVSVAIGEIADGVQVKLEKLLVKYQGLNGTELALSESQERMAIVIASKDKEKIFKYMKEENLEGSIVGVVTEEKRLVLTYNDEKIVDIDRNFLDTNGVRQSQEVQINSNCNPIETPEFNEENFKEMLNSLNTTCQRGMSEMFDHSIGRGTILLPYGGDKQLTQSEAGVQKIATEGFTNTCSILTYGFNPFISESSPYLSSSYAVVESLCKITAVGGDYRKARLSFQEYFEKLSNSKEKWGKPTMALLGALDAQLNFETPAIGGKDSMSGTFNDLDVPPTLISFAIATENYKNIISKEFNKDSKYVYLIPHEKNSDGTPNYPQLKANMDFIRENIHSGKIVSAGVVSFGGWGECIAKMSFGNMCFGGEFNSHINPLEMQIGSFVVSTNEALEEFPLLGELNSSKILKINGIPFNLEEVKELNENRFKKLYPYFAKPKSKVNDEILKLENRKNGEKSCFKGKVAKTICTEEPRVLITVFPGTNSEFDTEKAFKRAGGNTEIFVFNNLTLQDISNSINELVKKLKYSQIFVIPGGFSAGDEPDGSGKFIANILQNEKVNTAIKEFLSRQGLILGICNGFQALIKSGLLPYGNTKDISVNSPTLFRNDINRHISRMINTRISSNSSPWLSSFKIGDIHKLPVSHGEGKFIISEKLYLELLKNNQIATRYCDDNGDVSMDEKVTLNGAHYAVEGILSPCGQIFGKMAHSERYEDGLYKNISGEKLQDIFANAVNFFKK